LLHTGPADAGAVGVEVAPGARAGTADVLVWIGAEHAIDAVLVAARRDNFAGFRCRRMHRAAAAKRRRSFSHRIFP